MFTAVEPKALSVSFPVPPTRVSTAVVVTVSPSSETLTVSAPALPVTVSVLRTSTTFPEIPDVTVAVLLPVAPPVVVNVVPATTDSRTSPPVVKDGEATTTDFKVALKLMALISLALIVASVSPATGVILMAVVFTVTV